MKKIINPTQYYQEIILSSLFIIIILSSPAFGQDFESRIGQDLSVSTMVLSIAGKVSPDRMSISYNGLTSGSGTLFHFDKKAVGFEPSGLPAEVLNGSDVEKNRFRFGRKLKQMTNYFLRYFTVDDFSTDDENSKFLLKGKVNTDPMNSRQVSINEFEIDLSFNVGYDDDTIVKMNAIKLESCWQHTFVNAVYLPEKKEFEIGLSSAVINDCLLDGMRLEIQANPVTGSGALLFTMTL